MILTLKPVVYCAGRFSDHNSLSISEMQKHRAVLKQHAIKLVRLGYAVIAPIENDVLMNPGMSDDDYNLVMDCDIAILSKCDFIYLSPNWFEAPLTSGVWREYRFALEHNIPILEVE